MLLQALVCVIALQGLRLLPAFASASIPLNACFNKSTSSIPKSHIIFSKRKPLVIGHRGNPLHYQENTLAGFKSLTRNGADGFEVDVFLTKDGKVVCFHDKNVLRLTGVDRNIADMRASEIKKLRLKTVLQYGKKKFEYGRRQRVLFLATLLRWARRTDLLVYIEMKPSDPILSSPKAAQNSINSGAAVARLVEAYGMVDQVILGSYDTSKLLSAKMISKNLVIGTSHVPVFWRQPAQAYNMIKSQLKKLRGLETCLDKVPSTDSSFITYLTRSGTVEKAIGASFTDLELDIFDNCTYGMGNTMRTMRRNYSPNYVIGAYTIYSMEQDKQAIRSTEWKVERIVREGINYVITDDVRKLTRKVREWKKRYSGNNNDETEEEAEEEEYRTYPTSEEEEYSKRMQ